MKNKQVISYAVIGLILAALGFANFLAQRGSLSGIFNRGQATSTQNEQTTDLPLEVGDLEKLQASDSTSLQKTSTSGVISNNNSVVIEPKYVRIEATASGKTAFSHLVESVPGVKYKKYDFGFFIESINDLPGDNENFWAFYLNGEKSQSGADSVVVNPGEVIEFKYEKIEL